MSMSHDSYPDLADTMHTVKLDTSSECWPKNKQSSDCMMGQNNLHNVNGYMAPQNHVCKTVFLII